MHRPSPAETSVESRSLTVSSRAGVAVESNPPRIPNQFVTRAQSVSGLEGLFTEERPLGIGMSPDNTDNNFQKHALAARQRFDRHWCMGRIPCPRRMQMATISLHKRLFFFFHEMFPP